jgi:hypothetical protein
MPKPIAEKMVAKKVVKGIKSVMGCVVVLLGLCGEMAQGQTIADYSRSQRQLIEAEILRNNERVLSVNGQGSPVGNAPLPSGVGLPGFDEKNRAAAVGVDALNTSPAKVAPAALILAGVFKSDHQAVAELQVGEAPYWLSVGQKVPGTPWRVQGINERQVVLVGNKARRVLKLQTAL